MPSGFCQAAEGVGANELRQSIFQGVGVVCVSRSDSVERHHKPLQLDRDGYCRVAREKDSRLDHGWSLPVSVYAASEPLAPFKREAEATQSRASIVGSG